MPTVAAICSANNLRSPAMVSSTAAIIFGEVAVVGANPAHYT